MSVLIKGMKMPESCHQCVAGYGGFCFVCSAEDDGVCPDHGRPEWCPLAELPAQHGRLIDAYELAIEILKLQKYRFSIEDPEIFVSRKSVMQAISDNPTVIEADVEQATVCSATDCEHNVDGVCKKNAKEVKE